MRSVYIILCVVFGLILITPALDAITVIPLKLHKPFFIRADDVNIYIAQGPEIFIYSKADYRLIHRFGKAGEGPKEFKLLPEYSPNFDVSGKIILLSSLDKLSFFSKKGEFIREMKLAAAFPNQFYRVRDKRIFGEIFITGEDKKYYQEFSIYDMNLKKIRSVFKYPHHYSKSRKFSPIGRGNYIPNFFVSDSTLFLGGEVDKCEIHLFDLSGKRIGTVKPDIEKIPFTEADKRGYFQSYAKYQDQLARMKAYWKFPEYFPVFQNFVVADKRIYIQTFKRNEKTASNEFVILDLKGKLIKRLWLPLDEYFDFSPCPYTIRDGRLYQCVENEETERWELHVIPIK